MTKFRYIIPILLAAALPAHAQIAASNSGAQSSSGSTSGAQSGSTSTGYGGSSGSSSGAQVIFNTPGTTRSDNYSRQEIIQSGTTTNRQEISGNTTSRQEIIQGGSFSQTLRNVPNIQAPGIFTGSPCAVGGSAGGAGAGIGITLGLTLNDDDCELRMRAGMMMQAGQNIIAQEMMCSHRASREAFLRAGQPCMADRPAGVPPVGTPVAAVQAPIPVVLTPPGQQPPMAQPVRAGGPLPPWCDNLSGLAERRKYAQACGG